MDFVVSLIVVAENDEDIIAQRLREINKTLASLNVNYEIIVIDNFSEDKTVSTITKLSRIMKYTRILSLSKPYEKEIAVTAGIDACIGDMTIVFDLYTTPVEMIPYLLTSKLIKGTDIVTGKLSSPVRPFGPATNLFLSLIDKLSKHKISYHQSFTFGFSRKAINSIIRTRRKSRNFGYIQSLIGLKKETAVFKPLKKYKGKIKKVNFLEVFLTILDISISNSLKPLRIISLGGMFFSLAYIFYVIIIVVLALFFGMKDLMPKGWATVSAVLGTVFLLLFSLLALISEYIIRILSEARDEPLYFVSEEIGASTILPKKHTLNIL